MAKQLSAIDVAKKIEEQIPEVVIESNADWVVVKNEALLPIASFLKNDPDLRFDFLQDIVAVDYLDYFEVIYHLTSIVKNQAMVLKVRSYTRDNPTVPSVTTLWRGADFQEREVYDLMGVRFEGHPNLKRIFTWEGFPGHALRKDFL